MGRGQRRGRLTPLTAEPAPSRVPAALSASLTAPATDDRLERLSLALNLEGTLELDGQRFLGLVAASDYKGDPFCYAWIEAESWEDFCRQIEAQAQNQDDPNPLPNYVVELTADELTLEALDYDVVHGLERGEPLAVSAASPKALLDHLEACGY